MPAGFAPLPLLVYWCNAATVFGTNRCLLGRAGRRLLSKRSWGAVKERGTK